MVWVDGGSGKFIKNGGLEEGSKAQEGEGG